MREAGELKLLRSGKLLAENGGHDRSPLCLVMEATPACVCVGCVFKMATSATNDGYDGSGTLAPTGSLDDSGIGASPFKNQRISPIHFFKTSPLNSLTCNSSDANGDHNLATACIQDSEGRHFPLAATASNSQTREMEELRLRVQRLEIENFELRQRLEKSQINSKITDTDKADKYHKLEAELDFSKKMYKHTREVEESHAKRMKLMEEKVEHLESQSKLPHEAQLPHREAQSLLFDKPEEENKSPNSFLPNLKESNSRKRDKRPVSAMF